jgi:polysaccharide export outer membrane protein
LLQDEDVIVIDRNFSANLSYFLNSFTQPFRDILGFLLFFREISNSAEELFGPNNSSGGSGNRR